MLFFAALFLIIARFLSVWSGTPFPIALVTSDSMTPTLFEGDVVAWTPARIEDVEIGDVVVFKSYVQWPDEKIVVHRVSDIKESNKGNILLETKGDKNEWTDQAGPHIPEPYIREDNLMGKTISINKFPLKIPFVGLFGIWINEGFNLISQPTASKETINYLGVFAPLTISAVVLIILVFILPEKAKTFKEKIRLNIFGKRPLNIKKTIFTFLIAYILFFTVIHSYAFDTTTASVGINSECPDSQIEFGRIIKNRESFKKDFPAINPGALPVKGIVFAKGEIGKYISKETFELERGEEQILKMNAIAKNDSKNGSYVGDIMMYSSPFWLMFPDDFIETLYNWNAEATVYILDILSGIILTFLTIILLLSITIIGDGLSIYLIDKSWQHPSRLILKRKTVKKFSDTKNKIKASFKKNILWILNQEITNEETKKENIFNSIGKPALSALIIVPIIFIIHDHLSAIIISVILSGIIAYMISCKLRKKIVLTVLITTTLSAMYMLLQSNLILFEKEIETIELLSLLFGVIGLYMLVFTFLLVPLILLIWFIIRHMRNVKEQKDPLLSLEGRCDL